MTEPEALAEATTVAERAALFGYDFAILKRDARRIYWRSLAALCLLFAVVGAPVSIGILYAEMPGFNGDLFSIDGNIVLTAAFVSTGVAIATIVATQIVLRLVQSWAAVRQQVVAEGLQSTVEGIGLGIAVLLTRDSPASIVGLLFGCVFIAAFRAVTTTSVVALIERGSKQLPWVIGQLRTLPAEATVLGGHPWATVAQVLGRSLAVVALVIAVWSHPLLALLLVAVFVAALTFEVWASMVGRDRLVHVLRWGAPTLLLASAVLPAF